MARRRLATHHHLTRGHFSSKYLFSSAFILLSLWHAMPTQCYPGVDLVHEAGNGAPPIEDRPAAPDLDDAETDSDVRTSLLGNVKALELLTLLRNYLGMQENRGPLRSPRNARTLLHSDLEEGFVKRAATDKARRHMTREFRRRGEQQDKQDRALAKCPVGSSIGVLGVDTPDWVTQQLEEGPSSKPCSSQDERGREREPPRRLDGKSSPLAKLPSLVPSITTDEFRKLLQRLKVKS